MSFIQKSVGEFGVPNAVATQMQQDDSYNISDTNIAIAADIYNDIKSFVKDDVTLDVVTSLVKGGKDSVIMCKDDNPVQFFVKSDSAIGYSRRGEQGDIDVVYDVYDVEPSKVSYLVTEGVEDAEGVSSRFYHEPFESLEDAQKYQAERGSGDISVVDRDEVVKSEWYQSNMRANEYIDKLGKNYDDYPYSADVIVRELGEEYYQSLSDAEKLQEDKDVIDRLDLCLSEDDKNRFMKELDALQNGQSVDYTSRDVADKALIAAFKEADKQDLHSDGSDMYQTLESKLDVYDYRIPVYQNAVDMERMKSHSEMSVYNDKAGKSRFKGDWYMDGVVDRSSKSQSVDVAKTYGNHEFTDAECKALLNGESVTIKDFQTKMSGVMDITGKLAEKLHKPSGKTFIGFERTDMDIQNARVKGDSQSSKARSGLQIDMPDDNQNDNDLSK